MPSLICRDQVKVISEWQSDYSLALKIVAILTLDLLKLLQNRVEADKENDWRERITLNV